IIGSTPGVSAAISPTGTGHPISASVSQWLRWIGASGRPSVKRLRPDFRGTTGGPQYVRPTDPMLQLLKEIPRNARPAPWPAALDARESESYTPQAGRTAA